MRTLSLVLALLLASCSSIPKQGFATRYLGGSIGTVMRTAVVPDTDFAGNPIGHSYRSEFGQPLPPPARPVRVNGLDTSDCTAVAANRAQDVQNEGFDDKVQRAVYEGALADCRHWHS
jgi:hypothetical protein